MSEKNGNVLLFLGFVGIVGLIIWATTRSREAIPVAYVPQYTPRYTPVFTPFNPEPSKVEVPKAEDPKTTYNNTEEITFPDGFDPDTLMPRKIVVHRVAVVSK